MMTKMVFIGVLLTGFWGCRNPQQMMVPDGAHNSQNALDWAGTYHGTLPCADCEGLQTTLIIQPDMTYTEQTKYLGKSDSIFFERGNFSWNNTGSQIALRPEGSDAVFQYGVGENTLTRLDYNGHKISGDLEEYFILSKSVTGIYECYWKLIALKGRPVIVDEEFNREPYLIFKDQHNRVVGNAGCNALTGRFLLYGKNRIQITQLAATQMACPNLRIEDEFIQLLNTVDHYTLTGDLLTLSKKNSSVPLAQFKAVALQSVD